MIVPAAKTVFIDIPKTGSTSIVEWMRKVFASLPSNSAVNPAWNNSLCPEQVSLKISSGFNLINHPVRHEPLLSKYVSLVDFHNYFYFSVVRHPFERFKSYMYEVLLHKVYNYNLYHFASAPEFKRYYHDSWYLNGPEFKLDVQAELTLNNLKIINAKGWDRVNLCSTPLHIWPQVNFLALKTVRPYKLRVLHIEHINEWENDLKNELTDWTGIDTRKHAIGKLDPVCTPIYAAKVNSYGIETIPKDKLWEVERSHSTKLDPSFQEQFPTYQSFVDDYNINKKIIKSKFDQIMEDNRDLIENVYREDMIQYGYA